MKRAKAKLAAWAEAGAENRPKMAFFWHLGPFEDWFSQVTGVQGISPNWPEFGGDEVLANSWD